MSDIGGDLWPRLRTLLDRALELEHDARREYLDALRADDPELHHKLANLIAEHERLQSCPLPSAMELVAPTVGQHLLEESELDQLRVGQSIGSYRLARLLGTGGMGAVYLAERSIDGFTQTVALKVVRKALMSHAARDRFERERRILATLKHAGIALLFDGGHTDEGQSFYTMEYVDGEVITEYCERREAPVAERVRLLRQIAATLAYAHLNLVVHRDIKPSNVLVTKDGDVKLIDFGLAKLLDEYTMPTMTQTGFGPMTPAFAAPEQLLQNATTTATDVYQFGTLCFLVLAGRLPFRPDPSDSLEWARAVTDDEPLTLMHAMDLLEGANTRPAQLARARYKRQLTKDLDAIVRKSLAKSPDHRYRSLDAMIADFDAFLGGRPVSARVAGPAYFAWRFVQRRRYAVLAAALAMTAICTIGIVALRQWHAAAEHAGGEAREAQMRSITREMLSDLLRAGPASASAQRPRSALEALDQGAERTLRAIGENPQHRAIAVGVLAESYLELNHPQRARALIEQTLPMLTSERAAQSPDLLHLDLLLARAQAEMGDLESSEESLGRAEGEIAAMGLPPHTPQRLAAALVHVLLASHAGHRDMARKSVGDLLRDSDVPGLNETPEFADVLRVYALTLTDDTSVALVERAWKIIAKRYGEESPAALAAQRLLISVDMHRQHLLDSNGLISTQESRLLKAFGEDSPDYAEALKIHCGIKVADKEYARAETLCRQAVAIYEKSPDADPTLLANAHDNEGRVLLSLGRGNEASAHFERELALRLATLAPSHELVLHARLELAESHCRGGTDAASALPEFNSAIDDFVTQIGARHPYEAVYAAHFANCLLDAGNSKAAETVMRNHGRLDPPRVNMDEYDRGEVAATWERLSSKH